MRFYITIFLSLFLTSCDFNTFRENKLEDRKEAEKTIDRFYSLLDQKNKKEAVTLFSEKFFKASNPKDLDQILDWAIKEGDGHTIHSLAAWQTSVIKGTNSKSEYSLTYNVKRGKVSTQEIFFLEKKDDTIKIVTYQLNLNIPK